MRSRILSLLIAPAIFLVSQTPAVGATSYYMSGPILYTGWHVPGQNVNFNANFIYSNNVSVNRVARLRAYTSSGALIDYYGPFTIRPGQIVTENYYAQFVGKPWCHIDFNMYGGCGVFY